MIQDSINQMLGTLGVAGAFAKKQRQGYGEMKLAEESKSLNDKYDAEIERYKELGIDSDGVSDLSSDYNDEAYERLKKYSGPFSVTNHETAKAYNDFVNRMKDTYSNWKDSDNSEPIRQSAMNTVATEVKTPQNQAASLSNLIRELKGLTGVSDKIANNSTKKDLAKVINKYEGGK